jgi:hypothetical protein
MRKGAYISRSCAYGGGGSVSYYLEELHAPHASDLHIAPNDDIGTPFHTLYFFGAGAFNT